MSAQAPATPSCLDNSILHLILMPTEGCNFRCVYCYEDFKYNRMEGWVVRGVKNFLSRRAEDLAALNLSWFGGEPLLARDIMEDILLHAHALLRRHPGIRFTSDITTNAYFLSRPEFERLLDLGVTRYQISFDGPREWHDRKRVLADGRGTFDRVWRNLVGMRDVRREFEVIVRLHVDADNVEALPRFVRGFNASFGEDPRFVLFTRKLARLGGPNDDLLRVLTADQASRMSSDPDACVEEHRTLEHSAPICYAAQANSYLVRANGRLNKCTVALEHPANQVGWIAEDGRLAVEAPMVRNWMRGMWSGDRGELECPMHGLADP